MGIVGDHPESGVRVDVERPSQGGPPWRYAGHAVTATARLPMTAVVEADGAVVVELRAEGAASAPPADLEAKVRLILRAAWKHGSEDGAPPPRRIVRWRSEG
jgi:hypothetical protein